MSLSSLIVQREVATIRQVEEALARQVLYGGDLVTNLLEVVQLPERVLMPLVSESMGLAHAGLGELPRPAPEALSLVPSDLAIRRGLVPLESDGGSLTLAVAEPLEADVVDELAFALGRPIEQRVAPLVRIRQAHAAWYGAPLDRRMQRLVGRLSGVDTQVPNSLPPLFRPDPATASAVAAPPEPRAGSASSSPPAVMAPPEARTSRARTAPGISPTPGAPAALEPPAVAEPSAVVGSSSGSLRSNRTTHAGFPAVGERSGAPAKDHLVHLARAASSAPRGRRKRGPFPLEQATKEIDEAPDRDVLLDLFFDFAKQFFDYTALFIVHGDIAEGRDAFGPGASREKVIGIGVPLDLPSVLATARSRAAPVIARPAQDGIDSVLMTDLQRKTKGPILILPLVVRQRTVALLVGDGGEGGIDGGSHAEVAAIAGVVGQAFERLIVKKKLQGFAAGAGGKAARVDAKRVASKPPRAKVDRAVAAELLERALLVKPPSVAPPAASGPPARGATTPKEGAASAAARAGRAGGSSAKAESVPPPSHTTDRDLLAVFPRVRDEVSGERDSGELFAAVVDLPPPPQVAAVRRPSGPPIPREEPDEEPVLTFDPTPSVAASLPVDDGTADEVTQPTVLAPVEALGADGRADGVPVSQAVVVPPHRPPPALGRSTPSNPLPSVIVDVGEEFARLVRRLTDDPKDEHAEAELLRQGQHAMPAIMATFPGSIVLATDRLDESPPPRVTEFGPILRLIAGQRRVALPFVLTEIESKDPDRRFWATYLLTELPYADAVPAIVGRLFDPKERTRRVARLAAKAVAEVAREPLVEELDRIVRDPDASVEKRVATLDTLGDMRDAIVVPVLIGALGEEGDEVGLAARRALMIVTRQDFGRDARRWLAWWAANSGRHRVEWLIDALTHEVPAMRRVAGQELKSLTKEYFGYYDDLPKKERERAQQRYRDWWKTDGRARFRRL